jgi:plastocyanin
MRRRLLLLSLLLFFSAQSRAAEWHVSMFDFYFTPTNLVIAPGDTVIWSNKVIRAHDTTYYDPNNPNELLWMSDLLAKDESFSFTFTNAGFYPYVCAVHFFARPQQTGTVSVIKPNEAPTISLTNPPDGAVLLAPASFTLAANAADADGTVTQVQFFVNGFAVGTSTGSVFSTEISGLEVGTYILTAIATDNQGATNMASPVNITVQERPPAAFTLTLAANPIGTGSVQVAPLPNGPDGTYLDGTIVTLTAVPAEGFAFTNWSPGGITNNPLPILVKSNTVLTAEFIPYVPPRHQLTVVLNPSNAGAVAITPEPDPDGEYADATPVALAATMNPGFRFVNWSGATNTTNNPLLLVMDSDKTVTANFAAIPPIDYSAARGSFAGLLLDPSEVNFTTSGFLSLRISKTGLYRGTAIIGGTRQSIRGQFDRFGYAPLVLRGGTLSGSLQLDAAAGRIDGILTDGKKSPTLRLSRQPAGGVVPVLPGDYTLMVAVAPPVSIAGLIKLHVTSNGLARARGTLGDGVNFRARGHVSADGRLALFDSLYSGRGALLGWLNIANNGPAQGQARWFRPADSRSRTFPQGFALETPVNGIAESVQLKRGKRFSFLQNDALCSPVSSVPTTVK